MRTKGISVAQLFVAAHTEPVGPIPWGRVPPVPLAPGGVYVVATDWGITNRVGAGRSVSFLPESAADKWHIGQPVVYIGCTTRPIAVRLREFYRHKRGNRSPHYGGQDVHLLVDAKWPLWVWWSRMEPGAAKRAEAAMLERFARGLPEAAAYRYPFANRRR